MSNNLSPAQTAVLAIVDANGTAWVSASRTDARDGGVNVRSVRVLVERGLLIHVGPNVVARPVAAPVAEPVAQIRFTFDPAMVQLDPADVERERAAQAAHDARVAAAAAPVAPMIHATDSDGKRLCGSGRGARSVDVEIVTCAVCLAAVSVAPYATRSGHGSEWVPVCSTVELRNSMERNGLRYSELVDHAADVDAGHIVTADNGRQWRRRAFESGAR